MGAIYLRKRECATTRSVATSLGVRDASNRALTSGSSVCGAFVPHPSTGQKGFGFGLPTVVSPPKVKSSHPSSLRKLRPILGTLPRILEKDTTAHLPSPSVDTSV